YQAILQRLSSSGRRDGSASLAAEVQRQEEKFGTQRVWTFFPRHHLGERPEDRGLRATAMALLVTVAVTFLFAYFLPKSRHWQPSTAAGFAIFGLFAGVLFLAIAHQREK